MFRRFVPLAAVLVIVASCKQEAKAPAPAPAAPAVAAAPHTMTVHAKDFAFAAPDTVPAGMTTVTMVNDGPGIHHLQFVRLDSGKTMADFGAAMKKGPPFPMWAVMASGPNAAMPNASTTATIDLAPGNYALICFVDVPDKIPHVAKGMIRPLTVAASTAPNAPWPTADVTVTATEYMFALPDTLKAGAHTFAVNLAGAQPHEVVMFRLLPGKTPADFQKWGADYKGPPPVVALGGITATMPGVKAQFTADLSAGDYLLVCFIQDAKDGKPHIMHGMVRAFKVM